ncbi:MAG TPA: hypothetical protein VMP11_19745 [Verrucomicrobiae bacterium]|nr:hypothetical protein [Verrucomicrobiae bacterium]
MRIITVVGMFLLLAVSQSRGQNPLNLVPTPGGPDFTTGNLTLSYSGQTLSINDQITGPENSVLAYNYGFPIGANEIDFYGDFTLTATITAAGVLTGGSFTLNGDLGLGNNYQTPLLSGNLNTGANGVAFGSNLTTNGADYATLFQFPFSVTGGDSTIVSNFGGIGSLQGSVDLTAYFDTTLGDVPFTGAWGSDFNNLGSGGDGSIADIEMVPEPSPMLLVLVGFIACMGAYRATANKRLRSSR